MNYLLRWTANRSAQLFVLGALFTLSTGCQTLAGPQRIGGPDTAPVSGASASGDTTDEASESDNPVVQVSAETSLTEKAKKNTTRLMNLVSGREQENVSVAKQFYQQGDSLFRKARDAQGEAAKETFQEASKFFRKASEASPGTALQQDAMFMQAESLFFADRLTEASDVYERLQKDFPRNRHIDRVSTRLFSISRYWIETVKANSGWMPLNLTDPKRPRLDTDGHAIRVLDQIRYDDPTGRLADDATMAAAAEYIRQQKFEEADEFLTDLRETYADSEHLFLAHLLGIRCKLETYAGPAYSGLVLEEAETLVRQTRQRFPNKMAEKDYGERVAKAAAEIAFARAERLAYRADYREKRNEFGAARYYYNLLLQNHPDTPHAQRARQRLQEIEKLPGVPTPRLSWLSTIFQDSARSKEPLKTNAPSDKPEESKTILR